MFLRVLQLQNHAVGIALRATLDCFLILCCQTSLALNYSFNAFVLTILIIVIRRTSLRKHTHAIYSNISRL